MMSRRRIIISAVLILGIVILLIAGLRSHKPADIANGDEYVSPTSGAFLIYKNDTYSPFGTRADSLLRDDIAFFARKNFNAYNPAKHPTVEFDVGGKPSKKGNTLTLSGTFAKSSDKIVVTATLLKNNHIKTAILNESTGANLDTLLPSNSIRNQYIGTLPANHDTYVIDYVSSDDSFIITLNDTSAQDAALKELQSKLMLHSLTGENYHFLTPSSLGDGAPAG
ncbi:MAG: hypothetical protein JWO47_980 [Candidatus Saccharibacteria bacterium]|nr:hypothetical protein [Candidatus Saccharibacteria bacterium]